MSVFICRIFLKIIPPLPKGYDPDHGES